MKTAEPKHVSVAGAVYDATEVASHKSFEEFKAEADAQTKGNASVHWGQWPGDKREENLRAVYDQSVEQIRPKAVAAGKKEGDKQ